MGGLSNGYALTLLSLNSKSFPKRKVRRYNRRRRGRQRNILKRIERVYLQCNDKCTRILIDNGTNDCVASSLVFIK